MKRAVLFFPVVLPLIALALAETPEPHNPLKLIPQPKEVQLHAGSFRVKPTTRILVEFGHQAEDRIAARLDPGSTYHHRMIFRLSLLP